MDKIFPFLWVKGEKHDVIGKELAAIKSFGIDAVCIESRTHPDFCGESWFNDMRFILETAKKSDMRVWLLDDAHYPTGYANGNIEKHPEFRAWRIKANHVDVCGELKGSKVYLPLSDEESLIGVYAVPCENNTLIGSGILDLTETFFKNYVTLPDKTGSYKVIQLVKTHDGAERDYYIDMCNPASVDRLIEAVYQPHYEHFKEYFGNTFVGFFSDEPRFANGMQKDYELGNAYRCRLGIVGACYPWNDEIPQRLNGDKKSLLSLWWDFGAETPQIRCDYMRIITDMYGEYFSGRLSEWCNRRGVAYTGHIIEDMDAHISTGCSAGHYFKSMQGADIASVDLVLHQIKAFETQNITKAHIIDLYTDPEFFVFTLAKLASSCARLDKKKQGRALCEIFGAYGHGESVRTMLFLLNHMVSRGINHFIPHAFSMQDNDTDCPPYFNMGGKNPAIEGYKVLFGYMKRLCDEFSGGVADIRTAVIYHAEAGWSGRNYMPVDKVNKALAENQIDFDIVPSDRLETADIDKNGVHINGITYKAIILPYAEFLPDYTRKTLRKLGKFLITTQSDTFTDAGLKERFTAEVKKAVGGLRTEKPERDLRLYTYTVGGVKKTFAFNEGYGRIENTILTEDGKKTEIRLDAGQAVILYDGRRADLRDYSEIRRLTEFDVYVKAIGKNRSVKIRGKHSGDFDVHSTEEYADFSGAAEYVAPIRAEKGNVLKIKYFGEYCKVVADTEKVFIGGSGEYGFNERFEGEIKIVIGASLGYAVHDELSRFDRLEPTFLDSVILCEYK